MAHQPLLIARESFLMALAIASFDGLHTDLTIQTVLFPGNNKIGSEKPKTSNREIEGSCELVPDDSLLTDDSSDGIPPVPEPSGTVTPPPNSSLNSIDTQNRSVNRRMIAIESELEKDMSALKDRLDSKNKVVSDLEHELWQLQGEHKTQHDENTETKKLLKISQRRIE